MFIYSNHYLIVSKLTNETHKGYISNPIKINIKFADMNECEYFWYEIIDLGIYEFESYNYVCIEDVKGVEELTDEALIFLEKYKLKQEEHFDFYENNYFVHDKTYYSTDADPYIEFDWIIAYDQGFFPKCKKARDPEAKEYAIMNEPIETLDYFDDNLEENYYFFPKKNYLYYLDETTYDDVSDNLNVYQEDNAQLNFMTSIDYGIDIDSMEYWSEPLFVFGKIREFDHIRKEHDFFTSSYIGVNNEEWFDRAEYDTNTERDNFS